MTEKTQEKLAPVLVARSIDKSFPGVRALKDVSIEVYPHEVVGLVGENGAGKSTLMRILAGVYQPDGGEILIDGESVKLGNARTANSYGIGMVFQEQSLLPNISVGENIYLGHEAEFMRFGIIHWRALYASARRQLEKVESTVAPASRTDDLSFAERQMVELAKVLTIEERIHRQLVILLDEPTSVLEKAEIKILFDRVRNLRQRASFIFCSHRLDEVLEISDRVYVMKDGQVVTEIKAADASVPDLHRLMVGRGLQAEYYREGRQVPYDDEVALSVKSLGRKGEYRNVSFDLHKGEILGIAGVIGSGREQVCRTLFGFVAPTEGEIQVKGKALHFRSPFRFGQGRDRLYPAGAAHRRAGTVSARAAQHDAGRHRSRPERDGDRPRKRAHDGLRLGQNAQYSHAERECDVPEPERRQSAKSGAGQVDERRVEDPDSATTRHVAWTSAPKRKSTSWCAT